MSAWFVLFAMLPGSGPCQFISSDRILGEDLARAIPAFAAIPKDTILGYSPAPASRRFFDFLELKRVGNAYRIDVAPGSQACFEWNMRTIDGAEVISAMRQSLQAPSARVEILEMTTGLAPQGKVEFPVSGLSAAASVDPSTPVIWRGYVTYAKNRRFALWTRVRLSSTMARVVAVTSLPPNVPIAASQVRLETYDDFPLQSEIARTLEEVVGRLPRRGIRAGLPVFRKDLSDPYLVQRGESVQVTAISGAAQLELSDAVAQNSGRQGDMISLRNPRSGKIFRARVEGKDKAIVLLSGLSGFVARVQ